MSCGRGCCCALWLVIGSILSLLFGEEGPQEEKEALKFDTENIPFNKNYIAFIEVPKRYQIVDQGASNQLLMEADNEEINLE